ncbi:MAG: class I SAM-dependent methyltransferase [Saprospiraceae bacterium]|nr:class I SAM-dependent methyltransferase [Saprospiraceae bacterium]
MSPKDLFSQTSESYAQHRPLYPKELYEWVYSKCKNFELAWDCATGNGQVARKLGEKFSKVIATDLSAQQLQRAPSFENVQYLCESAESSSLATQSCDLITVAQAIHWFDFNKFYHQVSRVLKPNGILAVWVYENICINEEIDKLLYGLYENTLGPYWDPARKLIEEKLTSIPFPFEEIDCPVFEIRDTWNRDRFLGYLSSWSALHKYEKYIGHSPLPAFKTQLEKIWPDQENCEVRFPVYIRMGKIRKVYSNQ